jgi:ribosomal protein L37AE/L43A
MHNTKPTTQATCNSCGDSFPLARYALGYKTCLFCGEDAARATKQCIVPMHKSNYVPIFNPADLVGINSKGGIVK